MGGIQTKKLFLSKGNNQYCEKRAYRVGENLFHTHFRVLISKFYKELKKLYTKNTKNPINKWAKELDRYFTEQDTQAINKYMRKCSSSPGIGEIRIKTTQIFHLTPIRMAIIKNTSNNKYWCGCGGKRTLIHCWWSYKLVPSIFHTGK